MKPALLVTLSITVLTSLPACSLRPSAPPTVATSESSQQARMPTTKEAPVPTTECTATLSPNDSLTDAVGAAATGAVLCLQAGAYSAELEITRSITIRGLGEAPDATTITNNGDFTVVAVKGRDISVVLEDLTLRGGGDDSGGGLLLSTWADVTLRRCRIENNSSHMVGGGGIYLQFGRLRLEDCILEGNQAEEEGGAILMDNDSELVMQGGSILANRAGSGAALTLRGGTALLDSVVIADNEARNSQDPNIYLRGGSGKPIQLTLRGCIMDAAEQASLKERFPDHVTIE